jgi:uncharacterized repeat protein (TIGR03803 family)
MKTVQSVLSSLLFVGAAFGLLLTTSPARGGGGSGGGGGGVGGSTNQGGASGAATGTSPARVEVAITNLHSFSVYPDGLHPRSGLVQGKDGNYYGTTYQGGQEGGNGTVFKITAKGVLTTLYSFAGGIDGAGPCADLVEGSDGDFYGTTIGGGTNGNGTNGGGTVFKITAKGVLTTLYSFTGGNDGGNPEAALVEGSDDDFYCTTGNGGTNGNGTVFKITPGGTLTTLYSFMGTNDGANPQAALVEGKDGSFYGTAYNGGEYSTNEYGDLSSYGTIFKITSHGAFISLYSFAGGSDGAHPRGNLVWGKDGNLYGTTAGGGQDGAGTVFNVNPDGSLTSLYSFTGGNDGANPAPLVLGSDASFFGIALGGGANSNGTAFKITSGGTLTTLYSFTGGNDGAYPFAGLVWSSDGDFYGATYAGGTNNNGTVFKITPGGAFTSLYSFPGTNDGASPDAALTQGTDGSFYGMTRGGRANGYATVFKITPNGTFTNLYSFTNGLVGQEPGGALALGSDGNFYGTTTGTLSQGDGTVFKMTPNGTLTVLYLFTNGYDGDYPEGALVEGMDGSFYGTASYGGSNNNGTVFKIGSNGTLTTLYSFTGGNDGGWPETGLILGKDGNLYGTTYAGGTNGDGTVFRITTNGMLTSLYSFFDSNYPPIVSGLALGWDGCFYGTTSFGGSTDNGTVFKITPKGKFTSLYSFTNGGDGSDPIAGLALGNDGNFYGTANSGGTNNKGTVFKITTNGTLTALYSFIGANDGGNPDAALVQGSDGNLYGSTTSGGSGGHGAIFRILSGPSIVDQPPALLRMLAGSTLTLSVTADGLPALSYQWQSNGVALTDGPRISGSATGNLAISPLALSDAASYRLLVTNYFGAVTSAATVLTVSSNTVAPTVVIKSPGAGERTTSSLITGTASGDVPVTNVQYWVTNLNAGKFVTNGIATLEEGVTNRDWSFDLSNYPGTNLIGVRAWDASGLPSPVAARRLFFKVAVPLGLLTNGSGDGTFSGKASVSGDPPPTNGAPLNIGEAYSVTAIPGSNCLFAGWSGSFTPAGPATNPALAFIMESNTSLTATFVTNQFLRVVGTYNGLFDLSGTGSATVATAGMIAKLKVESNGFYTGSLLMAGTNRPLTGILDPATGQAVNHLPPVAAFGGALEVDLALQWSNSPAEITGAVIGTNTVFIGGTNSEGWVSSDLELYANSAGNQDSPSYTMLIPPVAPPAGYGYGLLTNHAGMVTIVGALADGTNFSQTVPIGANNDIPVYVSLYNGAGMLFGRLALGSGGSAPSGSLTWTKPTISTGGTVSDVRLAQASSGELDDVTTVFFGFTNVTAVLGSPWTNAPNLGAVILTNSELTLSGAGFSPALSNTVSVTGSNSLTWTGGADDSVSGAINPKTGLLNLTFKYGGTTFTGLGAVLQNQGQAGGFFRNGLEDGSIQLQP